MGTFWSRSGEAPAQVRASSNYAIGFARSGDDEFWISTGSQVMQWYSASGRFLGSVRVFPHGGVGKGGVATYGNAVIATAPAFGGGATGFALHGDSVRSLGVFGAAGEPLIFLAAAEDLGIWSAPYDRYVLRRHFWPTGAVSDSIVIAREWFPGPADNPANVFGLHAGEGLLWALTAPADPDAPDESLVMSEVESAAANYDVSAILARQDIFRDNVIEAFTPDGQLVASIRFDTFRETPQPIHGDLWFRITDDELSIVILEARLIPR